ncbi:MAG TPA: TolC family protein, partial [Myxococcota bacterium]|nr:TolC family protein [Myxococcota bacterium]
MRSALVGTCALALALAAPAWAQEAAPEEPAAEAADEPAAPPDAPVALPEGPPPSSGQLPLTLRDAIASALERNLDVELFRYDPAIAEYELKAAWGSYEPEFYGVADHRDSSIPIAQVFQGFGFLLEEETTGSTGVRGALPMLGWSYDFGYSGSRFETSSNIASLVPEYTANLTFAFNAPLLRGFLYGSPWVQVRLAGKGAHIANEDFRARLMDVVRATEDAYWNLAAAGQALEVARKSLETSRALLRQTQAQYQVGVVSKVEVTEAEAGVADREFQLIRDENLYLSAQDSLIDLVYGPALTPTSSLEIVVADSPENYQKLEVDPTIATEKALANRPELIAAERSVEAERIRLKFAKNQRLPQLDVVASYGTHGLAGDGRAVTLGPIMAPAPNVPDDYGDTHDLWFQGDDSRTWTAGARVSIPIGNTSARSNVRIGEIELHKAETFLERQRQSIVSDVRNAVRNLQSAIQGIEAAERRRIAAAEQHRAEQIRLEHGESTPFDVLQREEDLVEAESQKITALRVYHGSVVALDRAQGTLLEDRGIAVEGVKRSRA